MPEEKATLSKQPAPEKKPDAAKLPNAPPKTEKPPDKNDGIKPASAAEPQKPEDMKHELTSRRKERRIMAVWTSLVLTTALFTTSAFAADSDPLTIVNNLSDFIFSCIKAIGIIILGWGVVQLGMSVQSHDATQRTQGVLCLFGGLLIAFAKEILTAIGVV